jgi:hypothetical protein
MRLAAEADVHEATKEALAGPAGATRKHRPKSSSPLGYEIQLPVPSIDGFDSAKG